MTGVTRSSLGPRKRAGSARTASGPWAGPGGPAVRARGDCEREREKRGGDTVPARLGEAPGSDGAPAPRTPHPRAPAFFSLNGVILLFKLALLFEVVKVALPFTGSPETLSLSLALSLALSALSLPLLSAHSLLPFCPTPLSLTFPPSRPPDRPPGRRRDTAHHCAGARPGATATRQARALSWVPG